MPTFEEFLKYLSTDMGVSAAVNVIVMIITSYAIEFWPVWAKIPAERKRLLFMVPMSFAIPLLAAVIGILGYGWPAQWEPTFWPAFIAGFIAAFGGTLAHLKTNKAK